MPEAASASVTDLLSEAREQTDGLLNGWAERLEQEVGGREGQALAYALRTPGKRVRAALLLAAYRAVGGESTAIGGVAAAVETVHTYSLVHDDLPCMDNDDLRRGRPTTHRAFDVATATLAGYLLVPVAARILATSARPAAPPHTDPRTRWRRSCSMPAGSKAWSAGSGSTWRPSGAASPCRS